MDDTNAGAGPFTEIGGFTIYSTVTQYTINSLIVGKKYYFRYRALNQQGWSDYSPVTFIIMASVPSQITPAATT